MNLPFHKCCVCGHRWQSQTLKDARGVETARKVNKDGPYCNLCHHLTMAFRYADARGKHGMVTAIHKLLLTLKQKAKSL